MHRAPCNGRATSARGTQDFVLVLDEEYKRFLGTVDLRFVVELCGQVPPWDMTLMIRDGKLDAGESDYDGDGKPNNEERRGLEWDPDR